MKERIGTLYQLTKPGIVYGNAIHIMAGCFLAYPYGLTLNAIMGVIVGTSLVIASACVANNYIDRHIDAQMSRTKKRGLVTGVVSHRVALSFSTILLALGFLILALSTNWLVCLIGIIAYIFYVFIYAWAKRNTVYSTLIGSIPGALPAMAGYVAISGQLDVGAWLIFLLIVAWQMPHFYAISLFRKKDYESAQLPVLGVVRSTRAVKQQMVAYMIGYAVVIALLITYEYIGVVAGLLLLSGAGWWLHLVWVGRHAHDMTKWARTVFGRSLMLSLLLLAATAINVVLP